MSRTPLSSLLLVVLALVVVGCKVEVHVGKMSAKDLSRYLQERDLHSTAYACAKGVAGWDYVCRFTSPETGRQLKFGANVEVLAPTVLGRPVPVAAALPAAPGTKIDPEAARRVDFKTAGNAACARRTAVLAQLPKPSTRHGYLSRYRERKRAENELVQALQSVQPPAASVDRYQTLLAAAQQRAWALDRFHAAVVKRDLPSARLSFRQAESAAATLARTAQTLGLAACAA